MSNRMKWKSHRLEHEIENDSQLSDAGMLVTHDFIHTATVLLLMDYFNYTKLCWPFFLPLFCKDEFNQ